jgi:mannose-6-phosphate isomerase-like protein (cupin superfamily)
LHSPLEVIDVQKLVDACTDKWWNQTLCKVNDSVVRLGVLEGKYHWHEHNDIDEFFFVLDGHFLIDLEDKVVDLGPRQGFVVPKGVRHRTRAETHRHSYGRTIGYRSYRRLKSPSRTGGIRSANLEKLQAISLPPQ